MIANAQETKIENLRIRSEAKDKVHKVVDAIESKTKIRPTLSQAIVFMADYYLKSCKAA